MIMGIIKVGAHLVLEKPGELTVKERICRVNRPSLRLAVTRFRAEPTSIVPRDLEFNRDIVGHIPGQVASNGRDWAKLAIQSDN